MINSLLINGFKENFERFLSNNQIEESISLICNVAHQTMVQKQYRGISLRMPELDLGLIRIANLLRPEFKAATTPRSEHACLVTQIYKSGGHGAIMNSVCEEIPAHVIFTDLFDQISAGKIKVQGLVSNNALSSVTLNPDTFLQKVRNTVNLLNSLSPQRVWLFNHHQDVIVLLSALIFDGGRRSVFVHHCDHDPGLGATIKFPVHLDFTDELLQNCASIGLEPSPLALHTRSAPRRISYDGGDFVLATAGSFHKFNGTLRGMQYRDVVRTVLQHPRVKSFHHIGQVPDAFVADFRDYLSSCGIHPDRISFAGQVPCVSDYLLSVGAQVYLSSFPLGAGTTAIEVQSAGIPVIYFDPNQDQMPLCGIASVYASSQLMWRQLEDLHLSLDKVLNDWRLFSDAAYRKYIKSYSRDVFLSQLEGLR